MKKEKRRLLCALLSATTVMSMLTSATVVATNGNIINNVNDEAVKSTVTNKSIGNQQPAIAVDNNSAKTELGATGDLTLEYGISDDATYVIFTNGSVQTVDIPYVGGEIRYYPTTTDSKGHYNVKTW